MNAAEEKRAALRLLAALEDGGMSPEDAAVLAEGVDPVFLYVIVSYLRAVYPASHPAAGAVLERVVQTTTRSGRLVERHRGGEQDPVSRWFESEHVYGDFRGRGRELVELIADKLES
jgi:hypothetical protein